MSDWPQLEDALRHSARIRFRRRLRHRLAVVPIAVTAAAGAALLTGGETSDERAVPSPAATTAPSRQPADSFSVFRHPRSKADAIPMATEQREAERRMCAAERGAGMCFEYDTSRLVYSRDGMRVWLVVGSTSGKHRDQLCVLTRQGGRGGGAACKPLSQAADVARPMGSYGKPSAGRPGLGYTMFPDGVRRVAYTLADGHVAVTPVRDNISVVIVDAPVTSLSWTADGRRYVQTIADPDPAERAGARGCPSLDPLPADPGASAEAAAREAAPALYDVKPDDIQAVTSRRATPADDDEIRNQACGDRPIQRSVVVALVLRGQPRADVLVGFRDGNPIVWNQLR